MDVTLGSGWSFGGPHITPDLAVGAAAIGSARNYSRRPQLARPVPYEHEELIAAFVGRGAMREVDAGSFQHARSLGHRSDSRCPPGAGPAASCSISPAAPGRWSSARRWGPKATCSITTSRAAIETHLREAGDKLMAAAGPGGIHAIFCDSLEVYEAEWTPTCSRNSRGAAATICARCCRCWTTTTVSGRDAVRRDDGRTFTELYEERFLGQSRNGRGRTTCCFRIQGYGEPPASLSSYRYADLFDGEGFEWRMLSRARWAASAAHLSAGR